MVKTIIALLLLTIIAMDIAYLKKKGRAWWRRCMAVSREKAAHPAGQMLYHCLVGALPGCFVLAQVQLSRVLGVKHGIQLPRMEQPHQPYEFDFVVCLKDSTIVAAVELDGKSHELAARKAADDKKDKALSAAAGIVLIHGKQTRYPMRRRFGWRLRNEEQLRC